MQPMGLTNSYMAIFEFRNCQHLALALMTLARLSFSLSPRLPVCPVCMSVYLAVWLSGCLAVCLAIECVCVFSGINGHCFGFDSGFDCGSGQA